MKSVIKGKIRWFDSLSGNGVVRLDDGKCMAVHWSAILDSRKYGFEAKHPEVQGYLENEVIKDRRCMVSIDGDGVNCLVFY